MVMNAILTLNKPNNAIHVKLFTKNKKSDKAIWLCFDNLFITKSAYN